MLKAACCDGAPKGAAESSRLCATESFPGDSAVKNPPAIQEMGVQSLGQEDPPEKEMATHSSIFAWKIPWTEEPGRLQSVGSQKIKPPL